MMWNRMRTGLLLLIMMGLIPGIVSAQYKKWFNPDSTTLTGVSFFQVTDVIESGLPGQEFAMTGSISGIDSGGNSVQTVFLAQFDAAGDVQAFSYYEDQNPFLFTGPRAYALCHDGVGHFYIGMGSNDNQVVVKVENSGQYVWGKKVDHHDFYDIICEPGSVVALGQDESFQGVHDYSLVRLENSGIVLPGNMFGTVEFDVPERLVATSNGYLMVGQSFYQSRFGLLMVLADENLQPKWGNIYASATGEEMVTKAAVERITGPGFMLAGHTQRVNPAGQDSIYLMQVDTSGNVLWTNFYAIDSAFNGTVTNSIAAIPGGGYILAGEYSPPTGYRRPWAMRVNESGEVMWIRDYGEPDPNTEERINEVIVADAGTFWYGVGSHVSVVGPAIYRRGLLVKASLADGHTGCDSTMTVNRRPSVVVPVGGIITEQFLADQVYDLQPVNGLMESIDVCSTIVAVDPLLPQGPDFRYANPVQEDVILRFEQPARAGVIDLIDMQGRLVQQVTVPDGASELRMDLSSRIAGLYFLRYVGEDFASTPSRLLILR